MARTKGVIIEPTTDRIKELEHERRKLSMEKEDLREAIDMIKAQYRVKSDEQYRTGSERALGYLEMLENDADYQQLKGDLNLLTIKYDTADIECRFETRQFKRWCVNNRLTSTEIE